MLIAGIPVYANFDAMRNFHNISGVIPYGTFEELIVNLTRLDSAFNIGYETDYSAEAQFVGLILDK